MNPNDFWGWFSAASKIIADNPNNQAVISDLDFRVAQTWPRLSWEIGPDVSAGWYLAISPNLNSDYIEDAKQAISSAPSIQGWRFYPFRPRKKWNCAFEIATPKGPRQINSSDWVFIFLQYKDGHKEIVIAAPEANDMKLDERWQAAAVVLEGLIGEEYLLQNKIDFFLEPSPDARFSSRYQPIHCLPRLLGVESNA